MLRYFLSITFAMSPAMVYGILKSWLSEIVPLNQLLGIEIVAIDVGRAEARLGFRKEITYQRDQCCRAPAPSSCDAPAASVQGSATDPTSR